jgi:hypothetical protein
MRFCAKVRFGGAGGICVVVHELPFLANALASERAG